jgi:hypothetical protein
MDLVTLSQIANPILQTVFIAVIGLGYYFTVRATWATVQEMRAEHAALPHVERHDRPGEERQRSYRAYGPRDPQGIRHDPGVPIIAVPPVWGGQY